MKKLVLKKEVVSDLSQNEMGKVKGGTIGIVPTDSCVLGTCITDANDATLCFCTNHSCACQSGGATCTPYAACGNEKTDYCPWDFTKDGGALCWIY